MSSTIFMRTDTPIETMTPAAAADGLRRIDFPPTSTPLADEDWLEGASRVLP